MVEFLLKRLLIVVVVVCVFTGALMPLENHLKSISPELQELNLLEYRFSYTTKEVYKVYDELGFDNLKAYLLYQFCDLAKGLTITLCYVDLLTYLLRSVPSLASMDMLPFFYFFINVLENGILFYTTAKWPGRYPNLIKLAAICTTFKTLLFYVVCGLVLLGILASLFLPKQSSGTMLPVPANTSITEPNQKNKVD